MTIKIIPIGARILVDPIEPVDEVSARAKAAGLFVAVYDHNKPKPTEGLVVAVGTDPFVHEHIRIGDRVVYAKHSGSEVQVEGRTFRQLDFHEVITVLRTEPEASATASESAASPTEPS